MRGDYNDSMDVVRPVVLVAPSPGSGSMVASLDALRERCDLVFVEVPQDTSIEGCVAALDAARAATGLDEVYVLGHGIGGLVAQEFALASPDWVRGLVLVSTLPSDGRLEELDVPTLVIAGKHDTMIPPEPAAFLVFERIPDAELYLFERSGHHPHTEQPQAFVTAVAEWMAELVSAPQSASPPC